MSSALTPPSLIVLSRCPSPVVPGAWPQSASTTPTQRHERSYTYPPHSKPAPSCTPLHLDRVVSFHQRLSRSLSNSSNSHSSCLPSTSTAPGTVFTPSYSLPDSIISYNDSDLTRFTQHGTNNSLLQSANTSISTAYTAESVSDRGFSLHGQSPELSTKFPCDDGIQDRIYSCKRVLDTSVGSLQATNDDSASNAIHHPSGELCSGGESSRPERPRIVLPCDFATTDPSTPATPRSVISLVSIPTSPMVFASPTSSKLVRSSPHSHSFLHQTSDDTCNSFATSSSPSSLSPMSREHVSLVTAERLDSSLSSEPDRSSSMNMLTTLSLPGTPQSTGAESECEGRAYDRSWTQPYSRLSMSPVSVVSSYGQVQDAGLPALSPFQPSIPVSTVSPLLSPSSPSSSPTTEISSSHASFAPGHDRFIEDPEPTGAAEYAEAIMSFAWGSDSIDQVMMGRTIGITPTAENDTMEDDVSSEEPRFGGAPIEYLSKGTSTRKTVVERIKRIGGKIKRFWRRSGDKKWKDLAIVRDMGRRISEVTIAVDVDTNADVSVRNATGVLNRTYIDAPLSAIPTSRDLNVRHRLRKPRPSLNEHTYSTSTAWRPNVSSTSSNPPDFLENADAVKSEAETPFSGSCNVPESQTRTISTSDHKSRRLSVSAISNHGHSSGGQSTLTRRRPLSSIASVSRHILVTNNTRRTYCGPVNVEIEGITPDASSLHVNTGDEPTGGPPGLSIPTLVTREIEPQDCHLTDGQIIETGRNQTRRFSLSALSNLSRWKDSSSISAHSNQRRGSLGTRT